MSLSLAAASVGSLTWATYSGICKSCRSSLIFDPPSITDMIPTDGRRAVFLRSLPCLVVGSAGVATARSVPALMLWRVIQALGASSGMSVGAGVIGDIYKLEERGRAMGIFFGVSPTSSCKYTELIQCAHVPPRRLRYLVPRSPHYAAAWPHTTRHGDTRSGACSSWAYWHSSQYICGSLRRSILRC